MSALEVKVDLPSSPKKSRRGSMVKLVSPQTPAPVAEPQLSEQVAKLSFELEAELHKKLRLHCATTRESMKSCVKRLLTTRHEVLPSIEKSKPSRSKVARVTLEISDALHQELRVECIERNLTFRSMMTALILAELG